MAIDVAAAEAETLDNDSAKTSEQEREFVTPSSDIEIDKNNQDGVNDDASDDEVQIIKDSGPAPAIDNHPANKKKTLPANDPKSSRTSPTETAVSSPSKKKPSQFEFGPYVPILKTGDKIVIDLKGVVDEYHKSARRPLSQRLAGEILPTDSIIEAPSLVTPLLLKKKTTWPPKQDSGPKPEDSTTTNTSADDEIQVLKVVGRTDTPDIISDVNTRYRKPDEYIKPAIVASLTSNRKTQDSTRSILAIDDYLKSSAGKLLFELGLSQVMEYNLEERARKLENKVRRGDNQLVLDLANTKMELIQARQSNKRFKSNKIIRCRICAFKTEFVTVLDHHMQQPHLLLTSKQAAKYYLCNWCDFKTKDSTQILYHNNVIHRKFRSRLDAPMAIHCCRFCTFETNSKRKFTTHFNKCEQMFDKDFNQAPDDHDEYPAVTPKAITQQDVRVYESTLKAFRLAAYNPHQIRVSSPALGPKGHPILLVPKSTAAQLQSFNQHLQTQKPNLPIPEVTSPYSNPNALIGRGSAGMDRSQTTTSNQPAAPNLLRLLVANNAVSRVREQPSGTSLMQHPRPQSSFANGMSIAKQAQSVVMAPPPTVVASSTTRVSAGSNINNISENDSTMEQGDEDDQLSSSKSSSNPTGTFVICEICDAYIENPSSFKSHMQWVHKVKIHQKVLDSRKPPLNCQKCNWRYFTDQGLERHLLGSHGLVTSNMQDLADNDRDSGRCTICGIRCPRKLVTHMKDLHKVNLKPAQLSYKCTVCSATFSLYRHFENHVYRVHSESSR